MSQLHMMVMEWDWSIFGGVHFLTNALQPGSGARSRHWYFVEAASTRNVSARAEGYVLRVLHEVLNCFFVEGGGAFGFRKLETVWKIQ